ncbi:glutaredoxin [Striga asiatica]|uniref:Glutaredoxin n=1 Tax=Striga asiatica TaxID=4170 RepID=A0A5A7PH75_STRAF|nr:glutaredoxin [Striga asiatica]
MQGLRCYFPASDGGVRLELGPAAASQLSIDVPEPADARIRRLISENPVIVFSRAGCCMCHVMRRLLAAVGAHPTVIELGEDEIAAVCGGEFAPPALYVGGACVGGLESMVALHLSNGLVPKLLQAGALKKENIK